MNNKLQVGKAIKFNPSESLKKGTIAKKIPMGALTEFQRKIEGYENSEYISGPKFKNGDTLVAKITPSLENGKTAYVDILIDDEVAFGSSEFIVLRSTKYTIPEFVYYFARSPLFRKTAISCMEGTSGRRRVNEGKLKSIEFPFPDLYTQTSIAKVLSDLDSKIELNNKINQQLEEMAKTIYDYWFVQFDFPNDEGKPYKSSGGKMVYNKELKREIPEGWEVVQLKDVADTGSGGTPLSSVESYYKNGDIPWVNSGELNDSYIVSSNSYITEEGLNNSSAKLYQKNIILMAMYGATAGKVSIINIEATINQAICAIIPKSEYQIKFFLKYYLDDLYDYLVNLSSGSARDNLSQSKIRDIKVILPSRLLLNKFEKFVEKSVSKIFLNLIQNQSLSSLRDWLLPMLMNGQITVREAEDAINNIAAEPEIKGW